MPPKYNLEKCRQVAESHPEGRCLSDKYTSKMEWYCGVHDHTWTAQCNDVITKGKWCKKCGQESQRQLVKDKEGLNRCHEIATQRGGRCLSTEYVNAHLPIKWECGQGHTWDMEINKVIYSNTWCQKCHLEKARYIKEQKRLGNI